MVFFVAIDFYAALPIGNGRLGAMIYGKTSNETISLIFGGNYRNALRVAFSKGYDKIVQMLLERGACQFLS
jgi:hypothetical protein